MVGQLEPGQLLGDYEIVAVAGSGGMGIVYKATQRSLSRAVALKVIREDIAGAPEYRERFLREARLAASVEHPNVVKVYDVGETDGRLYLAMQWIEGEDLKQVLTRSGRLAPERAVLIATQLAGALDAVHSVAGLIHRDVKPANVLLGKVEGKDHAYLTDFGVAKPSEASEQHLTQTGWVVGTTGYLSPEQVQGAEPGPRSDLYALGCVFFEALTGQRPFTGDNEMAVRWAHASAPRPKASALVPALGPRYDHFLATALAVDPQQRFATGQQFVEALGAARGGQGETAATASIPVPHEPTAVGPPTPIPMPPTGSHTPPPGYPGYAYATPPPAAAPQGRSGNPLALILLALVAIVGIAVGALAAGGVLSRGSAAKLVPAASSAGVTARTSAASHPTQSNPPARTSSCGGDLSVGPDTSCAFAHNVEKAYDESSGGENEVTAYSPTTEEMYQMHCTSELPHVCTGGKGAVVYFDSGPSSTGATPPASPSPAAHAASSPPEGSSGALAVVDSYWESIREGQYAAAWADETPSERGTESNFVHQEQQEGIESISDQFSPGPSSGSSATIPVVELKTIDHRHGCRTWSGSYEVVNENGSWLISRANLEPHSC